MTVERVYYGRRSTRGGLTYLIEGVEERQGVPYEALEPQLHRQFILDI